MMSDREAYSWRPGSRFRVPAKVAGPEIARIERAALAEGRELTPADVVDAARMNTSPLHRLFDWDDRSAAEKYRLAQARQVIRCIEIRRVDPREEGATVQSPVYVHVTPSGGPIYADTRRVLTDDELRQTALDEAARLLEGVRARYARLDALSAVLREIDAFLDAQRKGKEARRRKKAATTTT